MDTYKYERGGFSFTFHVFVCVLFFLFLHMGNIVLTAGRESCMQNAMRWITVLQCVAVRCSVLQVYCPVVLYCVAVCCSVLQCVAVCCRCIAL